MNKKLLLELTSTIVSSYVSNNSVQSDVLPSVITSVFGALVSSEQPSEPIEELVPAVPIRRSVFPDYIVCLEDGKKLKMLKRHLASSYGLSADQYREKWGLPVNYPMVAPNYAEKRSILAREIGLGRKDAAPAFEPDLVEGVVVKKIPAARRGRRPKIEG